MALPSYATPVQRTYYYAYLFFCCVVFFFLVAPLIAIIPISFSVSPFMVFTDEMLAWPPDPEAWSLRWYQNMIGNCNAAKSVCFAEPAPGLGSTRIPHPHPPTP